MYERSQFWATLLALLVISTTSFVSPINGASLSLPIQKTSGLTPTEKLDLIRKLSREAGLPQVKLNSSDVCLDDGCLETALYLLSSMNTSVDPCKDFYQFSCGGWMEKNPVPPSSFMNAPYMILRDKVNNMTQDILREPIDDQNDTTPLNAAKEYFLACENMAERERVGLEPLRKLMAEFGGWQLLDPESWNASGFDWKWAMGESGRRNLNPTLVLPTVLPDHKDTDHWTIILDQPTLALPREIFLNPGNFPALMIAYENYIVELAQELGSTLSEEELRAEAKSIIALETKIANISAPSEGRFNLSLTYNPFLLPEFQSLTDSVDSGVHVDWKEYLDHVYSSSGVAIKDDERILVYQVEYIKKLMLLLNEELSSGRPTLANYFLFRIVSTLSRETTQQMREITQRFTQALLGGSEMPRIEVSCADSANTYFGMALGEKYIERANFNEEARDEMYRMVSDLFSTFKEMVRGADWMLEETKDEAIAKADAMRTFMGYPEWIRNKTALEHLFRGLNSSAISREGHFANHLIGRQFSMEDMMKDLRQPVDKDMWIAYPGTVNAFNFFEFNAIIFPAGFLQPPYFGGNRPKHQNYAGIGMVIGHEITHGFDDRGSQYDRNGNAENWWDPETKAEFERRGQCMINQYGNYVVKEVNMTINGVTTLGENIGDNGGLRESYKAYQKYVDMYGPELRLPGLESFSIDQLFFLGFANIWCETTTPEYLVTQLLTDAHSPSEFRVLGPLKNFNKFAEAFNCPVDENGMNPPQEDKCIVW